MALAHYGPKVQQFFIDHPEWRPKLASACPSGWDDLLAQVLLDLEALAKRYDRRVGVSQIKQKWAQLRVYVDVQGEPGEFYFDFVTPKGVISGRTSDASGDSITAQAIAIIERATKASMTVCEECGAPGQQTNVGSWYRVLCEQHKKQPRRR